MDPLLTSMCFTKCLLAAMLFVLGVSGQDTTTQTIQGSVYASPDALEVVQDFANNATAGRVYAFDQLVTDAVSNSTIGVLQGYAVPVITQQLASIVYTLTTAEGTLQLMGTLSLTLRDPESGSFSPALAITGGTGKYTGASGSWVLTRPPPTASNPVPASAPAVQSTGLSKPVAGGYFLNGFIATVTYPVAR